LKQFGINFRNDYATGDLLSTLRYLENKELLNDNFYNTSNCYLLDNAFLHKLQTDVDFRNSILRNQKRLFYPSGWLNGINPFNQANFPAMKDSLN
jgi:hypothetical protein